MRRQDGSRPRADALRWWCRPTGRVALALLAALAVACSSPSQQAAPSIGQGDANPGIGHIHGLGIDPADGSLYAAGHNGVFRVRDGQGELRGDLIQDTMGFTVAGPGRLLGSGHPDIRKDPILQNGMKPHLGLIESTDGAVTWKAQSLQGEVDFHALAFAHNQVYGGDATGGRFLVSTDMKTWDERSKLSVASVTVSPSDPNIIVAGAQGGAVRSTDGGRTWQQTMGGSQIIWVSWDPQAGLWGATPSGEVLRSTDGNEWTRAGSVDAKTTALLAHPTGIFVATDQAIVQSKNGGGSFEPVVRYTH